MNAALGLRVDPVYGGKTLTAMERWLDGSDPAIDGCDDLFWHCCYTPNWQEFQRASERR